MDEYNNLVEKTFQKHEVDNPELERAITDILNQALDSRNLSKRIYKDVIERYERDKRTRDRFR